MAVREDKTKLLAALLKRDDLDINEVDPFGLTALQYAIELNRPDLVKQLLQGKADLNNLVQEGKKVSALEFAMNPKTGSINKDIVALLLDPKLCSLPEKAIQDKIIKRLLINIEIPYLTSRPSDGDLIMLCDLFMKAGIMPEDQKQAKELCVFSLECDFEDITLFYLKKNIFSLPNLHTLLKTALKHNSPEVVHEFIKAGLSLANPDDSMLSLALRYKQFSVVEQILKTQPVFKKNDLPLLFEWALNHQDYDLAARLLRENPVRNLTKNVDWFYLQVLSTGSEDLLNLLMEKQGSLIKKIRDQDSYLNFLSYACLGGNINIIHQLLELEKRSGFNHNNLVLSDILKHSKNPTDALFALIQSKDHLEPDFQYEHFIIDTLISSNHIPGSDQLLMNILKKYGIGSIQSADDDFLLKLIVYVARDERKELFAEIIKSSVDEETKKNCLIMGCMSSIPNHSVSCLDICVDHGIDINLPDPSDGKYNLVDAFEQHSWAVLRRLLELNPDDLHLLDLLNTVAQSWSNDQHLDEETSLVLLKLFKDSHIPVDEIVDVNRILCKAMRKGFFKFADSLLDYIQENPAPYINKKYNNISPVCYSFNDKSGHLLERLVALGAKLDVKNKKNLTPLSEAVLSEDEFIVKLLLKYDLQLEALQQGLSLAIELNNANIVDLITNALVKKPDLLIKTPPLEYVNADGDTPLIHAIKTKCYDIALNLAKKGASLNAHDAAQKNTAFLLMIADKDCLFLREFLLCHQHIDLEIRNHQGDNPLSILINSDDRVNDFKDVHQAGADLNTTDRDGRSLLYLALIRGDFSLIEYMLDHGAKLLPTEGSDLLSFVKQIHDDELIAFVEKRENKVLESFPIIDFSHAHSSNNPKHKTLD
jgi:ankyrin repeat protein